MNLFWQPLIIKKISTLNPQNLWKCLTCIWQQFETTKFLINKVGHKFVLNWRRDIQYNDTRQKFLLLSCVETHL